MADNINRGTLYDKARGFAIRIVNLYKYLREDKNEYVMSKQILEVVRALGRILVRALVQKAESISLTN